MPRIMNQVSSMGEGHYGRGIGNIDYSNINISTDLAYNPPIPAGFVGPINPANYASTDSYNSSVLSQWESAAAQAAAQPGVAVNQAAVWLTNNWPLLAIGGIVGLLLVRGAR